MPSKLFVGNLSFNTGDVELSDLFASLNIPVASVKIMRDMDTGRSRGFGFVELAPEADMEAAIKQLNGKVVDGRPLTVNEARPQRPREFGGGGGSGRRGGGGGGGGNRSGGRGNREDRPRKNRGPALY
jgi:RNA recognition motif-containing protein